MKRRRENTGTYSDYDMIVIGAGIVGLACAYEYVKRNPDQKILVLEKETEIFRHQSGRNSGVIHSGIYYPPGSKKAKNCIDGYHKLLKFCDENNIDYELTGKLIVTTEHKRIKDLEKLKENGERNKLNGLKLLTPDEILSYEPFCTNAVGALYVPQTGIVNYRLVGEKYLEKIEANGSQIRFNSSVSKLENIERGVRITLTDGSQYESGKAVVATGVNSDKFISKKLQKKYRIFPFKGEYYKLKSSKQSLVKGLIYPLPDLDFPFLGVHMTKTMKNQVEAGPNAVLSLSRMKYHKLAFRWSDFMGVVFWKGFWIFAAKYWKIGMFELIRSYSKQLFLQSLQILVPSIQKKDIEKAGAGIRAQILTNEGNLFDDFLIEKDKNITYIVNAPSPAATSSLAIASNIIDNL